jgi:hypothetical protein
MSNSAAAGPIRFALPGIHVGLAVMLMVQVGCGGLMAPPAAPTPAEIPSLQAELERQPGSLAVRMRLAEAYRLDQDNSVPHRFTGSAERTANGWRLVSLQDR